MANTSEYKKQIEAWFRDDYLNQKYPNCKIIQDKYDLTWGGKFEYDAMVFDDKNNLVAVYCLSCSEYTTEGGNPGAGKLQKIKGDVLMFTGTDCPKKVLAFTGKTMYDQVKKQQDAGRLPQDFECEYVDEFPSNLSTLVQKVSADAVQEVSPVKNS